jgi:hypothetical protein
LIDVTALGQRAPGRAVTRGAAEALRPDRGIAVWSLVAYAALALAFWGPWVLDAPGSTILAANDIDPSAYLWFFSWWPHALQHGLNPFYTESIFVPEGYNLAWVPSMPGPSVLLAPVTLTLGPVATWNVISFAAPVLSAWTAFLLCRELTRAPGPSLVGGYLFGFSPYILGALKGAPQLAFVALLPVFVLLVLRHVRGALSDRSFVVAMTAALTAETFISTEVLATAVVFGGLALVVAYGVFVRRRTALRRTGLLVGIALVATAALAGPLLFYVFFRGRTLPEHALTAFPADLLSFVVPGPLIAVSGERVGAEIPAWAESSSYLGVPLMVLVAVFTWRYRRRRAARLAVIAFLIGAVAALGTVLHVGGAKTGIPLPWGAAAELPLLRYAIPLRFTVIPWLAAAVIVALWLAWRPSAARWAMAGIVVLSLLPPVGNRAWHTRLSDVPFFAERRYEAFLDEDDRVLTVPASGRNMLWHAQADFSFGMAAGYVGAFPESYRRYPAWNALLTATTLGRVAPVSPAELRRFVADKDVTAIVVERGIGGPWRRVFGALDAHPVRTGGVLLYRIDAA